MSSIITVLGATGQQGGSVARSLTQNHAFHVRGTTRDPNSTASEELKALGVEIRKADVFNKDEVKAALQDASGLFLVVDSANPKLYTPGGPSELDITKAIIDAAVEQGVKNLVLSGGPPWKDMTDGKAVMIAAEMKWQAELYAKQLHKFDSIVVIHPGMYMQNHKEPELSKLLGGFPLFPDDEGYLTLRIPRWGGDGNVPFINIMDDFGDLVHGIFLDPSKYNGKVVQGISDIASYESFVADVQAVTSKKARLAPIEPSWQAWDTAGNPGLEEIKNIFGAVELTDNHYFGPDATEIETAAALKKAVAKKLNKSNEQGQLGTVRAWIEKEFA